MMLPSLGPKMRSTPFFFEDVEVIGIEQPIVLNGHFHCRTGYFSVNFVVPGVGPVRRYDLGGSIHNDVGRFHEHRIVTPDCVRRQLPTAVRRDDMSGISTTDAWKLICAEAAITHTGTFFPPEVRCQ